MLKLYGYFRSSASYRVRIALNMKRLDYEQASIHLAKGRQYAPEFSQVSPQNLVPVLEHDGQRLYQSLAIIEYLDEKFPQPAFLPKDAPGSNRVRSLALIIACEIHPLNNTRVLAYLTDTLKLTDEQKSAWYRHWVTVGFTAIEKRLATEKQTGRFCHGTNRVSPISCWCRKWPMPIASRSTSIRFPPSGASMTSASSSSLSRRRCRRISPTLNDTDRSLDRR